MIDRSSVLTSQGIGAAGLRWRKPLRGLNDKGQILGLSMWDLSGLGYILIGSHQLLEPFRLEWIAFVVASVAGLALSNIRLKMRSHIFRDFGLFYLRRQVIYDPKTR